MTGLLVTIYWSHRSASTGSDLLLDLQSDAGADEQPGGLPRGQKPYLTYVITINTDWES